MNKQRIQDIDRQIEKLSEEKKRLEAIERLPEIEKKVNNYITTSYSGKKLMENHSLSEIGLWKIRGEDPNCDLGGSHYQPELGTVQGTLKEAIEYAVELPSFYTWGSGGDIEKISVIIPKHS